MTFVPSSKGPAPIDHHPSVACLCGHPRIWHSTGGDRCEHHDGGPEHCRYQGFKVQR